MTVTKNTIIAEILNNDPTQGCVPIFLSTGMHCLGCMASHGETVEEACAVHGVDADELVDELAEGCGRRFAVAQNGELMANKRVVRDMKMHSLRLPRADGQWVARRRFRDDSASVPLVFDGGRGPDP